MERRSSIARWSRKFRNAFRGLGVGIVGQNSFFVHFIVTALVVAVAGSVGVSRLEWCLLFLCIGMVLCAEMFNSALESCAKAITREVDDDIRDALDIASAAVLVAAIFASLVGVVILGTRLGSRFGWLG